jgi:GntR family transcriptional regulator/MocR family aminotransferase
MSLFIDPSDPRGRAVQVYEQLRDAIVEGRLAPGHRLAATRPAAAELGVSRSTITEAYARLVAEGYVEGRAGGGTVVSGAPQLPRRSPVPTTALAPSARAARVTPYNADPETRPGFDLRAGSIDPSLFPMTAWRRCLLRALDHWPGHYGDPAGEAELRAALAGWVTRSRGVRTSAAELIVTSGAGHAVDLVARVLVDPGGLVAVEEPGYPPVVELLRSHGLRVVGVPVDDHGIVVDALPAQARLVYVTPSHQYPLGVVMARRRRLELLDWAARVGAAIIEDDYDSELRHTDRPLEPLQRLDHDGRVVYVATFSKTLSPGLRIGFMIAPASLLPALRAVRQVCDWCPPLTTQLALAELITSGHLDRHLRRARAAYRERHGLMWRALGELLPAGFRQLPAHAGLHLAVIGPDTPADEELQAAAAAHGVRMASLRSHYHFSDPVAGFLVGFGALSPESVPAAARAVAATVQPTAGGSATAGGAN